VDFTCVRSDLSPEQTTTNGLAKTKKGDLARAGQDIRFLIPHSQERKTFATRVIHTRRPWGARNKDGGKERSFRGAEVEIGTLTLDGELWRIQSNAYRSGAGGPKRGAGAKTIGC